MDEDIGYMRLSCCSIFFRSSAQDVSCLGTLCRALTVVSKISRDSHAEEGRGERPKRALGPNRLLLKVYKAAGSGMKGPWSFSQLNRPKALARIEPEPNINQIE